MGSCRDWADAVAVRSHHRPPVVGDSLDALARAAADVPSRWSFPPSCSVSWDHSSPISNAHVSAREEEVVGDAVMEASYWHVSPIEQANRNVGVSCSSGARAEEEEEADGCTSSLPFLLFSLLLHCTIARLRFHSAHTSDGKHL